MGGEAGVLRREERFGKLVLIRKVRGQRLGAGEGGIRLRGGCHQGGGEVRLGLGGDARLWVERAKVD